MLFGRSEPGDERFLMRLEREEVVVTSAKQDDRSLQAFNKSDRANTNESANVGAIEMVAQGASAD